MKLIPFPSALALLRVIGRNSLLSEKLLLFLSAILAAINGVGFPLLPVIFSRTMADFSSLYNTALQSDASPPLDPDTITAGIQRLSLVALLFGLAAAISTYIMTAIQVKIARAITTRIRTNYFTALMRQDISWHNQFNVGALNSRFSTIKNIELVLTRTYSCFIRDIFAIGFGFTFAFISSWRMSLVIIAFMPIIAIVGGAVSKLATREAKAVDEAIARATGTIHESVSLIRAVLAYGGQRTESARYKHEINDLYKREVRRSITVAFGTGFLMLILMACFAAGFLLGNQFVLRGYVSLADAISASAVVPAVFAAFRVSTDQKYIATASNAARSLSEVIDRQPVIDPLSESGLILDDFQGGITFENVHFRYERTLNAGETRRSIPQSGDGQSVLHEQASSNDDNPLNGEEPPNRKASETGNTENENDPEKATGTDALAGFNLDLAPGASLALCGPSGSGKSTVISLIERFYDVDGGRILLDGKVDIRDVNIRWLRSQIGHVGQTPTLLRGTIRENIENGVALTTTTNPDTGEQSVARSFVPMQDVVTAAKAAHAHEFIDSLPDGYDTQVGDGGAMLSGGQKQRICIARALIRNPKVLLLDESTASLDNKSEAMVQKALDKASKNRTTLTIAHRLTSLRNCDVISYIKDGRLVESGSHAELLQMEGGEYKSMVDLQTEKSSPNSPTTEGSATSPHGYSSETDPTSDGRDTQEEAGVLDVEKPLKNIDSAPLNEPLSRKNLVRRVFNMQKQDRFLIAFGVLGSIAVGMAWPLAATCIAELLQMGVSEDQGPAVRKWSLLLFGCGIIAFLGILFQHSFLTMSGERLTRRVRIQSFTAMLSQDMSFFDRKENNPSSLAVKLNTQAPRLRQLASDMAGAVALGSSSIIAGVTIGLHQCPLVALTAGLFAPGLLLTGLNIFDVEADFTKEHIIGSVRLAAEALYEIQTISSLGLQRDYITRYEQLVAMRKQGTFSKSILPPFMMAYSAASPHCLFGASFWIGSIILRRGICSFLSMNKAILAIFFGSVLVGDIIHVIPKPRQAKHAAAEHFELMSSYNANEDEHDESSDKKPISLMGDIEFTDVRFTYASRPGVSVLNGFSTKVQAGQTYGLVGESGSGKSTIISLIERFYASGRGSIYIKGKDVSEFKVSELRSRIGIVLQNPELFNRTVKENIAYGLPHSDGTLVSQDLIESAARTARIHDFIVSLEDGYDTVVGVRGERLSGGQRQRVAIARAIVRDPDILLLDEATSALDVGSEKEVQEGLEAAASGRTTITVAHRLVTIRHADNIGVMRKGAIIEEGTHNELMRQKGAYAELHVCREKEHEAKNTEN